MDLQLQRDQVGRACEFMDSLATDFEHATKVSGRSDYSAFYAPCLPSPLLVLNANPGGSPEDYKIVRLDAGEHEYIEGYGRTSQNTGRILMEALGASSKEGIRGVQGSNVIWRRSPNLAKLNIPLPVAAKETAPYLARLIAHVCPRVLLFGGSTAFDLFVETHKPERTFFPDETLMGPVGPGNAVLFSHDRFNLTYLTDPLEVFTILHPSKGRRPAAMEALKRGFELALK